MVELVTIIIQSFFKFIQILKIFQYCFIVTFLYIFIIKFFDVLAIRSDQISRSVVSDSLRPHESQHARPPCASPTPGVHSDSRPSSQWCHKVIAGKENYTPISLINISAKILGNEIQQCVKNCINCMTWISEMNSVNARWFIIWN